MNLVIDWSIPLHALEFSLWAICLIGAIVVPAFCLAWLVNRWRMRL